MCVCVCIRVLYVLRPQMLSIFYCIEHYSFP